MPDITMCANHRCPKRRECYRHEATPDKWQSYAGFAPDERGQCDHFVPMETCRKFGARRRSAGGDKAP